MSETQNYKNHVRWFPLQHFIITPILLLILIYQAIRLYQEPNWDHAFDLLIGVVLLLISLAARMMALTVQNRLVRLEEKLRYRDILPPDLYDKASNLRTGQIIALRFASDEELPDLVQRTLAGELKETKQIKLAVKNWRGDYLRV